MKTPETPHWYSNLAFRTEAGAWAVPPEVHPLADLLSLSGEEVLARFKESQVRDFSAVIDDLGSPTNPLAAMLRDLAACDPAFARAPVHDPAALKALFSDLHDHVMGHPVWRHPFFLRFFEGPLTDAQVVRFASQYFNQVKNTRQCVALAAGRFHGLMPMAYPVLGERISELTQIVLAQLIADEYGVGTADVESYPDLAALLNATTHIVMYRRMFDGLGVAFEDQDVPLIPEVADNVLIQRAVAGDPRFSSLEALSSVGLGMEWGVPEFFSLLLGGMIRHGMATGRPLTRDHLIVLIAHVRYDVLHAIAVMLVTSLHGGQAGWVDQVKGACNMLMAGRNAMMSGLYRHVFETPAPAVDLPPRYRVRDRRIVEALLAARQKISPQKVTCGSEYLERTTHPFES